MPVVTRLRRNPRIADEIFVDLDGERWNSVDGTLVLLTGLRVGATLTGDQVADLTLRVADAQAFRAAKGYLARRPMSAFDLRERLRRKGLPAAAAESAVARCAAAGLIDDAAFARWFAEAQARRGYGQVRVRAELGRRGIDREHVDAALEATAPEDGGVDECLAAVERKYRGRPLEAGATQRTARAFLARRGFTSWQASRAMERYQATLGLPGPGDGDGGGDEE